jgi:hypothetical protein
MEINGGKNPSPEPLTIMALVKVVRARAKARARNVMDVDSSVHAMYYVQHRLSKSASMIFVVEDLSNNILLGQAFVLICFLFEASNNTK